jgi:hypothetical protein
MAEFWTFATSMIALKVRLNGKQVCVAGADDLAVLNAIVTASGKLGNKTVPARPDDTTGEIFYSVGGLTARPDPTKDVHMRWKSVAALNVGDVIQVEIVETDKPDRAKSRTKAKPRKSNQTVQRTEASRSVRSKNRASSAAGSRR